ncbi:LacI family DNA-binding transcriptional regulator [Nonomuraea dietziae]|uniref:LacI family DNA-binding transcriptional regulator n=1 Tax=Nonomuraea dietziae TaxID=65515 RepID=UPI003CD0B407
MDEPTAALGVKESGQVLDLIRRVRDRGLPVVLISHNMPHVFEIADRIHVQRLGRRVAQIKPGDHSMAEVVAIMTGAMDVADGKAVIADKGPRRRSPFVIPLPCSRQRGGSMASARRPTMTDVAREVGVTAKTVSRVLNEEGPVAPETRARVMEVVRRLGYHPT